LSPKNDVIVINANPSKKGIQRGAKTHSHDIAKTSQSFRTTNMIVNNENGVSILI
jgi:hypothetical protein